LPIWSHNTNYCIIITKGASTQSIYFWRNNDFKQNWLPGHEPCSPAPESAGRTLTRRSTRSQLWLDPWSTWAWTGTEKSNKTISTYFFDFTVIWAEEETPFKVLEFSLFFLVWDKQFSSLIDDWQICSFSSKLFLSNWKEGQFS